jgi:hypothetical protein
MCVFITAVPITKLFAWGERERELDDVDGCRLLFLPGNFEQDGLVCGRPDRVVKEVSAVLGQERLDRGKDDVQVLRASGQSSCRFRDIDWWRHLALYREHNLTS